MFMFTEAARARFERNRRKAKGLIGTLGSDALDYVRSQIDERSLSSRDRAHWQRVERHVVHMLREMA
jgi:hypothetical protein